MPIPNWGDFTAMIKAYPAEAFAFAIFVSVIVGAFIHWLYRQRIAGFKEEIERLNTRLADQKDDAGTAAAFLHQQRLLEKQRRKD